MYLILATSPDAEYANAMTRCLVFELTQAFMDRCLQYMNEAKNLTERLGPTHPTITLSFADWSPEYYRQIPEFEEMDTVDLLTGWLPVDALENSGYALVADEPFPASEETSTDDAWFAPVLLAYSEMCASPEDVFWVCHPKYGSCVESSHRLDKRTLITELLEALNQGGTALIAHWKAQEANEDNRPSPYGT